MEFLAVLEHCSVEQVLPLHVSQDLLDPDVVDGAMLLPLERQRETAVWARGELSDGIRKALGEPI